MATIRQRGKKKAWYALYRDAAGKLIERTCKTTDKKKAQAMADEWERVSRPSANKVTSENMRRVLADMHKKYLGEELPMMSVADYFSHWLSVRKNEVSADTYAAYEFVESSFIEHLKEGANSDLFKVQKTDIVFYRDAQRLRVSARRTNNLLKILRMVFRQAKQDGWIPEDPTEGVKFVKMDASEKNPKMPFTLEQLRNILAHCDEEWKSMTIRGYYTGQRLLDIALMTAGQEDPHLGQVTFWTNKTTVRVISEMHPAYVQYVLNQPSVDDPNTPLHPRAYALVMKRKKNRTATISNQFSKILADAGLRQPRKHRKMKDGPGRAGKRKKEPLSFHSLRHSLVSHLADAGVSRSVVQDIVGHESAEINAAYTHLDRKTKQEAMAKLPDILG